MENLNRNLKNIRKKFIPELEPKLIDYDEELFKRNFPNDKNIDFRKIKNFKYWSL